MTTKRTPVVFIHGLWLHSTSWRAWAERFREAGFEPVLPEWPGVPDTVLAARRQPEPQSGVGLAEIAEAHVRAIRELPSPPVLIGHSVGGFITQHLLGEGLAAAAVAIAPAPIKGVKAVGPAQAKSTFAFLRNPANIKRVVSLNQARFRYAFANTVPLKESEDLFAAWTIPSPARPLFQLTLGNVTPNSAAKVATENQSRGPLLLLSGKADHTVPDVLTRATFKRYAKSRATTEYRCFEDRGHSLILDHGWPEIADASLSWLADAGFPRT
ncbi:MULTISPECIES: alpha/beta fold hydrolase [unclassified Embleya]|uniref:alpha/beta hydrolase n=1 Tax=unclassified Embleya TaxID=2699296 RepID=UPI0033C1575C